MTITLKAYGKTIIALLICSLLFSLVLATLYSTQVISSSLFKTLGHVFSFITFFISGAVLGFSIQKKAMLHALGAILVLFLVCFFKMEDKTLFSIGLLLSKLVVFTLVSVASLNLKSR